MGESTKLKLEYLSTPSFLTRGAWKSGLSARGLFAVEGRPGGDGGGGLEAEDEFAVGDGPGGGDSADFDGVEGEVTDFAGGDEFGILAGAAGDGEGEGVADGGEGFGRRFLGSLTALTMVRPRMELPARGGIAVDDPFIGLIGDEVMFDIDADDIAGLEEAGVDLAGAGGGDGGDGGADIGEEARGVKADDGGPGGVFGDGFEGGIAEGFVIQEGGEAVAVGGEFDEGLGGPVFAVEAAGEHGVFGGGEAEGVDDLIDLLGVGLLGIGFGGICEGFEGGFAVDVEGDGGVRGDLFGGGYEEQGSVESVGCGRPLEFRR